MIDKELKREIMHTVNVAVREAMKEMMLSYQEEWVSEDELCAKIQMFTRSGMRQYGKFLPQTCGRYTDSRGMEHDTRTVYGLHAIQQMILNGDLDFTRKDRCQYRTSQKRKKKKM